MNFKVVHILPEELEELYPQLQEHRGYYLHVADEVYLYIGSGFKPTDGYSIGVSRINPEHGSLIVDVTEGFPEPGKLKKPNPDYPYTVISLDITPEDFKRISSVIVRNTVSLAKYDLIEL